VDRPSPDIWITVSPDNQPWTGDPFVLRRRDGRLIGRGACDIDVSGLRPVACVVGEASEMQPILAQKGRLILHVTARGHAAHSSEAHRGVNAVHAAAEAIAWLAAASRRHAKSGPDEAGFDPPYTTLQVSDIASEGLPNTVPGMARFAVEWRNIPADDPRQEIARFKDFVAGAIEPAGIACMVCGPGHVSQVHQPDGWIAESQLATCDRFIRRIVDRLAG
jgi:acetylornithine deacetylase